MLWQRQTIRAPWNGEADPVHQRLAIRGCRQLIYSPCRSLRPEDSLAGPTRLSPALTPPDRSTAHEYNPILQEHEDFKTHLTATAAQGATPEDRVLVRFGAHGGHHGNWSWPRTAGLTVPNAGLPAARANWAAEPQSAGAAGPLRRAPTFPCQTTCGRPQHRVKISIRPRKTGAHGSAFGGGESVPR